MWIFVIFVVGLLIIIIPSAISQAENNKNVREEQSVNQKSFIESNNINITADYQYENMIRSKCVRFIADDMNKSIYLSVSSSSFEKYLYSDLIGCEIFTDNQVTGGIKRAVVGGLIAGDAGAIVGATTAKNHIMSYKIVLYFNNVGNPKREINLIEEKTTTKNADYQNAVQFAENINATVKAIINQIQ